MKKQTRNKNMKKTLLLLLPALLLIMNPASSAPKAGKTFKDWVVMCQQVPKSKKQHCHIAQTASNKKTNKAVLHTMVGRLVGQNTPVAIFIIPELVGLKTKLQLVFSSKFSISFNVESCDKKGKSCHAGVPLDKRILAAFKKGKVAYFVYKKGKEEKRVPISLMGLSSGLNALPKK
jgi:invasion protein IalB